MSRQRLCDGRGKKKTQRERKRNKNAYKKFQIEERKKRKKKVWWVVRLCKGHDRENHFGTCPFMRVTPLCVCVCVFRRCQFSFSNFFFLPKKVKKWKQLWENVQKNPPVWANDGRFGQWLLSYCLRLFSHHWPAILTIFSLSSDNEMENQKLLSLFPSNKQTERKISKNCWWWLGWKINRKTYGTVTGKSGPSNLEPSQKQSSGVMMAHGKMFSKICKFISRVIIIIILFS